MDDEIQFVAFTLGEELMAHQASFITGIGKIKERLILLLKRRHFSFIRKNIVIYSLGLIW